MMEGHIPTLPLHRVDVIEEGTRVRPGVMPCVIGKGRNIHFDIDTLQSYFFEVWNPLIFDALVVAAAVEFCDKTLPRPSRDWGRDVTVRILVHNVGHWKAPAVFCALSDALNFITGDRWTFQFRPRRRVATKPQQGRFSLQIGASAVMPFSDGLDSWAMATIAEREHGTGLHRVRLLTKKIGRVSGAPEQPFAGIPYQVKTKSVQSGGRSRGFTFALISGIAAYLAHLSRIIVPESGQGALGPVLTSTGQAYPDYRSHPLFMAHMEKFLVALLGHRVSYEFPRLWYTKGETLRAAVAGDPTSRSWLKTRSCWQDSRRVSVSRKRRQCGVCAACMLRRLSVNSAGLDEPREAYIWENLRSREFKAGAASSFIGVTDTMREYAIAGTLHLDHLAELGTSSPDATAIKREALLLSLTLKLPLAEVEMRLSGLLRKHQEEWGSFLDSLGSESFVARWAQYTA